MQWRERGGTRRRQAFRNFGAVDAVHPGEIFRDLARLVALNRSDEVPFQAGRPGEGRNFFEGFLHVVFAKNAQSARMRGGHRVRAERFADGDESDAAGIASAGAGCLGDALSYGLQVDPDCGHNFVEIEQFTPPTPRRSMRLR